MEMDIKAENNEHNELIDLKQKCRVCLQYGSEMNPFFDIYYEDLTLANVFKTITSFEVSEDDRLPKNICESCSEVVINFNIMISVFQKNEEYLNKLLCLGELLSTDDDKHSSDGNVEYVHTGAINTNVISDKIEYFDETIIKREEVETLETIEGQGELHSTHENCEDEAQSPDKCLDEPEITGKIENDINQEIYSSENFIGNGDYNRVQTVKYTCECGDCFLHEAEFLQHLQSKHNTVVEEGELDEYTSEIKLTIPTEFPTNIEYVSPIINERKNKLHCRICTLFFSSPAEVKQHEEIHKTYVCHQCGAAFLKKYYLADHLLTHSDGQYACKVCAKTFRTRHNLNVHKRTHDVARSFVCETCGAGFRASSTLSTHKRLKHTNERNYPCTACNLRFKLKSTLDKHFLRKHTSNRERSFACTKCTAAYFNKTNLTRHLAEKHSGKAETYPCNICENKVYNVKKNLEAHLQNKHNIF